MKSMHYCRLCSKEIYSIGKIMTWFCDGHFVNKLTQLFLLEIRQFTQLSWSCFIVKMKIHAIHRSYHRYLWLNWCCPLFLPPHTYHPTHIHTLYKFKTLVFHFGRVHLCPLVHYLHHCQFNWCYHLPPTQIHPHPHPHIELVSIISISFWKGPSLSTCPLSSSLSINVTTYLLPKYTPTHIHTLIN